MHPKSPTSARVPTSDAFIARQSKWSDGYYGKKKMTSTQKVKLTKKNMTTPSVQPSSGVQDLRMAKPALPDLLFNDIEKFSPICDDVACQDTFCWKRKKSLCYRP
ncbi:hypothetical protein AVEN_209804-1 [Araneus ventricosus]|uniref:Uncharacterized protein n=1 Tax=Araneus ventricosus TaxID=182803 RepID=A0A4Y2PVT4_ARAVE|nr:hypothetical protein AVEN_209804-1 [Araneus ventricosus]